MVSIPFDAESERQFVAAVLAGHAGELARFEERLGCIPKMLKVRNLRMGSPLDENELNDVIQDTFLVVLRRLPNYVAIAPFESWVYGVCCLQIRSAVRVRSRERGRRDPGVDVEARAVEGNQEAGDAVSDVEALLALVGGMESELIRNKHLEGLTFDELAARYSISSNTAKTLYYRGLRKIRNRTDAAKDSETDG